MFITRTNVLPLFMQLRGVRRLKQSRMPPFLEGPLEDKFDYGKVRTSLFVKERHQPDEETKTPFSADPDAPIELAINPYEKTRRKCILCGLNIKLDYKNARLLQQFVSSFSGRVYDKHITGLCNKQHQALLQTIAESRKAGNMPAMTKEPKYLRDPKLFDPLKPLRPHSYD